MTIEPAKIAAQLLRERSRDTLIEGLDAVMKQMGQDQALPFLADLLLTSGADRDHLKQRLAALLATQFGRRSEKASEDQLDLFAEALRVVADAASEPPTGGAPPAPPSVPEIIEQTRSEIDALAAQQRANRKAAQEAARLGAQLERATGGVPWPTHLPVREVELPVPEAHRCCPDCGAACPVLRYETSWRVEYTTSAEVVVTRAPVVACAGHHGGPRTTPVPPKPVDGGQMGFSLAARLIWLRITHNLPVRRIAEMMQAEGVPVTETMIHTLLSESGERFRSVAEALHGVVQQAALVNLDDTPVHVYEVEEESKETLHRKARVWLALGDERFAYFFATKSWKADEAEEALGVLQGVLQGDGYKGFPRYAKSHRVTLAGCMAHLRRKLNAALAARDPRATYPLALVQGMYQVEELAKLRALSPEGRLALRRKRSIPLMQALLAWAKDVQPTIETGSPLGKAWTYLSNQLGPLQVFLTDGAVSIDNNAAERGLRRITIGRKLWLFFRGQSKLEHITRLLGVLSTARLHGVEELAYLTWLLEQLARREWSVVAARQLLPDVWLAAQKEAKQVCAAK